MVIVYLHNPNFEHPLRGGDYHWVNFHRGLRRPHMALVLLDGIVQEGLGFLSSM